MPDEFDTSGASDNRRGKHPVADGIEDVITFKLHTLCVIQDRSASQWADSMFDLSIASWRVLAVIRAHQPTRAGDVAEILLMDKSQLSRVIKQLTAARLIVDTTDPNDGRAVALKLTAKGTTLYGRVMTHVLERNEKVLAPLTVEEVGAFDAILDKLIVHSRAMLEHRP
ncbi:DNA-binding transcriptional repressor MarR [Sulfitobacter sp. THAF37]|uniref:MarR family winged helix-turn-helix transcriptional regulator n=1 Tax=Sulfitobacter sp. THAF37 TaxID=2587855 RepID=UPI001267B061|nr:MarR family winged helix-turn-helix transcriptional regulator [Sulfitobacter sp. THAF37]QFT57898.1 DNA-binding transcriptional repressor MarR [Sulfitobacter sp. THAF37]